MHPRRTRIPGPQFVLRIQSHVKTLSIKIQTFYVSPAILHGIYIWPSYTGLLSHPTLDRMPKQSLHCAPADRGWRVSRCVMPDVLGNDTLDVVRTVSALNPNSWR